MFVELCCGTAIVGLRLRDPRVRPITPYWGGKSRWAAEIQRQLGLPTSRSTPLLLNDAGPWGAFWQALQSPRRTERICAWLDRAGYSPETLWRTLAACPPAEDPDEQLAQWVCLQAGNVYGKLVYAEDGRWITAGFAGLAPSAIQRGFRHRFQPRLLAERVRATWGVLNGGRTLCENVSMEFVEPRPGIVYIDPPYRGRVGYRVADVPPLLLQKTIERWCSAGAVVVVSEARPLPGGRAVRLAASTSRDDRPKQSHQEYLTIFEP